MRMYSPLVLIAASSCWLLALGGVAYDSCTLGRAWSLCWWLPLTLLLGPVAALLYIASRGPAGRTVPQAAIDAPWPAATDAPTSTGYSNGPQTMPGGSSLYLLVQQGAPEDLYRSVELPAAGVLVVRRALGDRRTRPGTLLLHDVAVSRTQHCLLTLRSGRVNLEDISTNGTFVDQQHVHQCSVSLRVGSSIRIGHTALVLRDDKQTAATQING